MSNSLQKLYAIYEKGFQSEMKVCYQKRGACMLAVQSNQTADRFPNGRDQLDSQVSHVS